MAPSLKKIVMVIRKSRVDGSWGQRSKVHRSEETPGGRDRDYWWWKVNMATIKPCLWVSQFSKPGHRGESWVVSPKPNQRIISYEATIVSIIGATMTFLPWVKFLATIVNITGATKWYQMATKTFLPWEKFRATIVRKSLPVDKTSPAFLTCAIKMVLMLMVNGVDIWHVSFDIWLLSFDTCALEMVMVLMLMVVGMIMVMWVIKEDSDSDKYQCHTL